MRPEYKVRRTYLGDGATSIYTIDFKVVDKEDLLAIHTDATGDIVWNVRATDTSYFTTTLSPDTLSGQVTLINPLPLNHVLILLLADDNPIQPAKFETNDKYTMKKIENTFDVLSGQIQRLHYLSERSIKFPEKIINAIGEMGEITDESVPVFSYDPGPKSWSVRVATTADFKGDQGDKGDTGEFDNFSVVGELEYDDPTPMSVTNTGTATNAILDFILRKGPKGDTGNSTVLVTVDTTLPNDAIGGEGDMWFLISNGDPDNGNVYQKTGGTYTLKGNIMGPAGGVNSIDTEQGDLVYAFSGYSARFNQAFNSTSLRDTLSKILNFAYLGPLVTLNSNIGTGPYEKGQAITAINFTAAVTKRSNNIEQVEFLEGATVLDTQTSGGAIPNGGNSTYSWTGSITDTTTFTARVTDESGGGGPSTVSGTRTFNYVFAYHHGVGATGLNAVQIAALTKVVSTPSASQVLNYTLAVGQVPYFAYPNSLSALTQITDENGFDVTSSWTSRSVVITNTHGQSATYRVYEFNNPAGAANTTFYTFKR